MSPRSIEEALAAHNHTLMALPGVVGTAVGLCHGVPCIRVFVAHSGQMVRQAIPLELDGYPVEIDTTGTFRARTPPPG